MIIDGAVASWSIAGLATAGVIVRPFRIPEWVWAAAGAIALVGFGLLPWTSAWIGVVRGLDVYLFLTGMMLIAELARQQGVFDWLAALAVEHTHGSPQRLFTLVYLVGTLVTVFLSNDATAVVLTPAVYAATRAAGARPLSYLLVCAFVANAASFVLPISNPANLVIFGRHMPDLPAWIGQFALPSIVAIGVTYLILRITQRRALANERIAREVPRPQLGRGGLLTAWGIGVIGVVLMICSALDADLGFPTFVSGVTTTVLVLAISRKSPLPVVVGISWSVLPLVAGLFVLVQALDQTGVIANLSRMVRDTTASQMNAATWAVGLLTGLACNLLNNLPVGLIAGSVVAADPLPAQVVGAALIGVDLGPNLSVTGSLATILWLVALRREKLDMGTWNFLRLGLIVMPPALVLSILAMTLSSNVSALLAR